MDTSPDYTLWIILVCFGLFVVAWELNQIARQLSRMNDREDEAEHDRREREDD